MEITEVRIKLIPATGDRLKAFCSITIDNALVVRDLKIIEGVNGLFVAMPSRKISVHCPKCGGKIPMRAAYCHDCGHRLPTPPTERATEGRAKLYADIAHPINSECRDLIERAVVSAYHAELVRSRQPGYVATYSDDFDTVDLDDVKYSGSRSATALRTDPRHGTSAPTPRPTTPSTPTSAAPDSTQSDQGPFDTRQG